MKWQFNDRGSFSIYKVSNFSAKSIKSLHFRPIWPRQICRSVQYRAQVNHFTDFQCCRDGESWSRSSHTLACIITWSLEIKLFDHYNIEDVVWYCCSKISKQYITFPGLCRIVTSAVSSTLIVPLPLFTYNTVPAKYNLESFTFYCNVNINIIMGNISHMDSYR